MTTKRIWQSIEWDDSWAQCNTNELDLILPAWLNHRDEIKSKGVAFEDFVDKLKRKHAIETGIIENLYFVEDNLTKTLITEGFQSNLADNADIKKTDKASFFRTIADHLESIEHIYEYIRQGNELSLTFIRHLHALVADHQETYEAVEAIGESKRTVHKPLIKGEFKTMPNNPSKYIDGEEVRLLYCPPEFVQEQMTLMVDIYNEQIAHSKISPAIKAAWLHHAFTSIHPFPDGNGRVARLLASYSLIKDNLFPFSVAVSGKQSYFEALEQADAQSPQLLVTLFANQQKEEIRNILSEDFSIITKSVNPRNAAEQLKLIANKQKQKAFETRQKTIRVAMEVVFRQVNIVLKEEITEVEPTLNEIGISILHQQSTEETAQYYTQQIINCAKLHNYLFRKDLDRFWTHVSFRFNKVEYYLIISLHHISRYDDAFAISSFIREIGFKSEEYREDTPLEIEPVLFSVDENFKIEQLQAPIRQYISAIMTYHITNIAAQIG